MNAEIRSSLLRNRAILGFAWLGLLLVCALNFWLFAACFNRSYIKWYSSAGPFIAVATAAFGSAWGGLDRNPALVSANPMTYVGACLQVAGLPLYAVGTHLRSSNRRSPVGIEMVPIFFLGASLALAIFLWLLLIVPAQYFLFLIVGSLSRVALTSTAQISARIREGRVALSESSSDDRTRAVDGWWDASMRSKPITLASAFGAALLYLTGLVWN